MGAARTTRDHGTIRRWAEARGGAPAIVRGTGGMLRIAFRGVGSGLEETTWAEWLAIFDDRRLLFLHDPAGQSRFYRLLSAPRRDGW